MSPQPNRLSTSLNSKFLFNYISTPFVTEESLKNKPAMCRAFLIHKLDARAAPYATALDTTFETVQRVLSSQHPDMRLSDL